VQGLFPTPITKKESYMKLKNRNSLLVIILLLFSSCSKNQNLGPKDVLLQYLDARLKSGMEMRSNETYQLLSKKDKEVMSVKEYLSDSSSIAADISYELVLSIKKNIF